MEWEIAYYEGVQEAITAFPPGLQARFVHLRERIIAFGPNIGMPHARALGKGLFELRMKRPEGIARVFFGLLPGRRAMMLHAFVKKSQKTPAHELKIARRRLKEVKGNAQ